MITTKIDNTIINIVIQLIYQENTLPTTEVIHTTVKHVIQMFHNLKGIVIEEDRLIREVEAKCNVYVPVISTLDDMHDHQEWLSSRRAGIEWRFWNRYRQYLENGNRLPPQAIRRLDDVSDQILSRLENPLRCGPWDRRGMVVGQVQSGKTSNYTALICKAVDAGYKLIIVLAGTHNSLRSQTQLRLDEGFLGFDTQQRSLFDPNNIRLGVGLLPGVGLYHAHSLTNSADSGDFKLQIAKQANVMIGGADPVLLVVKKNTSVLKNLYKWSTMLQSGNQEDARNRVRGVPLLLIDDEADNASINTRPILDQDGRPDAEIDPTKINGWLRRLLNSFEQSVYIGYTATPFANIFIADNVTHEKYGEDLYPRSFIVNLQPPSNYLGPTKLFGLVPHPATDQKLTSGLPLIRRVDDHSEWMPDGHKKEHRPGSLPQSVKEAIKAFILTCAARHARGQVNKHNSMLIHVTRFTAVQTRITEQVQDELSFLQQRLRYGDGHAPDQITADLKALWDANFVPIMQKFDEPDLIPVTWDEIKDVLYTAAAKIEVRKINGTAKDTLQYIEHKDGLSVICIGGDKLSRGLTLEGLSISYYLRASRMYDTLMQMGRWFGYRPGYIDLCRLYTTSELRDWYRDIAAADEELRQMFEDMAAQDKTPADYGLGVRKHPAGLMITAAAKMRNGQKVTLSYSKNIAETVVYFNNTKDNEENLLATDQLVRGISATHILREDDKTRGNYIWDDVNSEVILEFLDSYKTHEAARKAQSSILYKYIKARVQDNELTIWTVALISNRENAEKEPFRGIANFPVGLTVRQRMDAHDSPDLYRVRRLVSPSDEWIDLSDEEVALALAETQRVWRENPGKYKSKDLPDTPSGMAVRKTRSCKRGLLLLYVLQPDERTSPLPQVPIVGFAISFPKSNRGEEAGIAYVVNNVYWQQEFGEEA